MDIFSDLNAMNVTIKIMKVFKHSSLNSVLCSVTCYIDERKYLKIESPGKHDFANL